VPNPPLAEQRRIVAILDEAFARLEKASANAEKNLANARELFDSYLGSVFDPSITPWPTARLGDVCQTGAGGTPLSSRKEYYEGGTIPWLVSGEVAQGEIINASNFITDLGLENSSAKIFPQDTVLVAMYGATAGQVGILRFKAATNQAVCGVLPNNKFLPKFMYYLLLSKKQELIAQAAGNAQPNISQIKIKNTTVPVPPLAEQKPIVAVLDALREQTERLETLYRRKIEDLAEAKQSILQKAFSGELTAPPSSALNEAAE
jgi:type I restriction enzyme S subunit